MRKPYGKFSSERLLKKMRRKLSLRKKISGTVERPRLCVNKSNKHLRVNIVDDSQGVIISALSTFGKNKVAGSGKTKAGAEILGVAVGNALKDRKISAAVFDRAGHKYHGVIASIAEGVRKTGIQV